MSLKKTATGKWQYRYRDLQGRQRAKTFSAKQDAQSYEAQVRLALRDGTWISPSDNKVTVGNLWLDFIALKASKKLRTQVDYKSIWHTHLEDSWSNVPARRVSQVEFMKWLLNKGVSPIRADKIHLLMTMILDVGVQSDVLARNVLLTKRGQRAKANLPKPAPQQPRVVISLTQLYLLATECAPYKEFVLFLGIGGPRFGEAVALKVKAIDFQSGVINIEETLGEVSGKMHRDTPKNHQIRQIFAPKFLIDLLQVMCVGKSLEDFVFTTPSGTPIRNANFARRVFKPALKKLALPQITLHDLRHTAVSVTKSVGADLFDVKEQVGHADIRTTINTYGKLFAEDRQSMAKKLNEKLENVHEMCTKAENDAAFQLLLARNSLDLQGFPEVDLGADEARPTDYESAALTS